MPTTSTSSSSTRWWTKLSYPLSIATNPIRDNGNIDVDDSVGNSFLTFLNSDNGYLEVLSSKNDNPNDKTLREGTDIIVPSVGMKFKDEIEMFEFYKNYAYQVGFLVRKRNSKKGDDGIVRYITFTCSREGLRNSGTNAVLKPQPTIQIGSKARLTTCSELDGIWCITRFMWSTIIEQAHQNHGYIDVIAKSVHELKDTLK
ncbi:unnamed protein product [Fraxinus pennsylvanica]|uniref:FAR1 domain-containing protein n=1 Tax=Fraxinus pennsylvanica TaxID=56036 RepID=A0AAD2AF70_9LAMI|nr:unnamed protein product [Fraxinus pennsylvanica]